MIKKVMSCKFTCIARARSNEELKNALNDLCNSDYWKRGDETLDETGLEINGYL